MTPMLIGHVIEIFRYPVKGMRGESIPEAELWWTGLRGDRRFAFMNPEDNRSGFPWFTGRRAAEMVRYEAGWVGAELDGGPDIVWVKSPSGRQFYLGDAELAMDLEGLFSRPPQLVRFNRGCFDAMPVSVISRQTIRGIGVAVGAKLDRRRFRPNLVLDIVAELGETEDDWLGRALKFGDREESPVIRLNRKNARCAMITIDPETGNKLPQVLKYVAQVRDECVGVYGSAEVTGAIRAGDPVYLV